MQPQHAALNCRWLLKAAAHAWFGSVGVKAVAGGDDLLEGPPAGDHGQHVLDVRHHDIQQVGALCREHLPAGSTHAAHNRMSLIAWHCTGIPHSFRGIIRYLFAGCTDMQSSQMHACRDPSAHCSIHAPGSATYRAVIPHAPPCRRK